MKPEARARKRAARGGAAVGPPGKARAMSVAAAAAAACALSRKELPPPPPAGKAMRRESRPSGQRAEDAEPMGDGEAALLGSEPCLRDPREQLLALSDGKKGEEEEEKMEREHFRRIINAFRYYGINMHERVNRAERQFRSLPANQQNLLPQFLPHLDKIRKCIDHNQGILHSVVRDCTNMFENKEYGDYGNENIIPASTFDMDKLKSTLKQFVRDWSETGKHERDSCYQPIINEIVKNFPKDR